MATLENINQLRLLTGITSAGVGQDRSFAVRDKLRARGVVWPHVNDVL
jgi:hypothetical protein